MEIRGSAALVTGAGRGIGRAIALALAREGADVTVVSRTAAELDRVVDEIEALRRPRARVRRRPSRRLRLPVGGRRPRSTGSAACSILVNNAGVGVFSNVADTSDEDWDAVLGTNLTAVFRMTRAALPHLTNRGGHVLMISSLAGSNPAAGMAAYGASKAALDYFAHCLMLEVRARNVKVTTIAPGSVDTSFSGLARPARRRGCSPAEDLAQTVVDLLRMRDGAHSSRVEMRPARPQKR